MDTTRAPQQHFMHGDAKPFDPSRTAAANLTGIWSRSTLGDKLAMIGAAVCLVGFFLPWLRIPMFFTSVRASGITLAREFLPIFWAFPAMMAAVLALSVITQAMRAPDRPFLAAFFIAVGAGWAWPLIGAAMMATLSLGGYAAIAGSVCVLAGGFAQLRKSTAVYHLHERSQN